ncbi:VCBS repeat-containing protein [Pelagicoccus sp. NFK12]|uniref:VCBS repeat-containing protein n=1 Tax=Pelagicoccus enzymogenes TaxID=2773457 RepID=A0A927FCG0_9BACT|nr:FG-GAP-like repeat-containing protein [Pelagicoccus enzymogenes]MBD5782467.1 VCBS repeat-containing protein [Pelagicoccus enzymogenes]
MMSILNKPYFAHFRRCFAACLAVFVFWVQAEASFTEVSTEAGLTAPSTLDPAEFPPGEIVYHYRGGVAVGDFDGDGWQDIFLTRHFYPGILYRNNGDGTFSDATEAAQLPTEFAYHSMGAAFADLDNDGDQDLVVTTVAHSRFYLYVNQGNGTFKEEAIQRGADLSSETLHNGASVAVGDYDRDGWLDLAFADWSVQVGDENVHLHSALLRNRGRQAPGYFENTTTEAGVEQRIPAVGGGEYQFAFTPSFVDTDLDNWPDLFLTADFYGSRLLWNNGDRTFFDGSLAAGIGAEDSGVGGDIGDVDGDGRPDWIVTAIAPSSDPEKAATRAGNHLYRNIGDREFLDFTDTSGIRSGGWSRGGQLLDYDNDGDLDFAQVNGASTDPQQVEKPEDLARPVLWENDGTGHFADVAVKEGLVEKADAGGMVAFDYDRDGDLDLLVASTTDSLSLYRNDRESGNVLRIRPEGFLSNRDGFNSKIWVQASEGGPIQYREYNPTGLYLSSGEQVAHFGLGDHSGPVHSVRIRWTSGLEVALTDVEMTASNNVLVVQEPLPVGLRTPVVSEISGDQDAFRGQEVRLQARANGVPEVEYQWYHYDQLIPGATASELVLSSAQPADAGDYHVRVRNLAGSVESATMKVTVRLANEGHSVARRWNEALLDAIRKDYPAPTVHSRNLYHVSAAMWDAWAAYDETAKGVFYQAKHSAADVAAAREQAISYAAYRILTHRYADSPGHAVSQSLFDALLADLGYDAEVTVIDGDSPAAIGNRIAATILLHGLYDGANEENGYVDDTGYQPVNEPFNINDSGTEMVEANRWQPISFDYAVTQNGLPLGANTQEFLGSNWGKVKPFAMSKADEDSVYFDPGSPPLWGTDTEQAFQQDALEVVRYSSYLDPATPGLGAEALDIGPATSLNNPMGTNQGSGYNAAGGNPVTGEPYELNLVKHADYGRVLAEFWADGPHSETPPGHWNTVANDVSDHPLFERRFAGEGEELDPLEWDVKLYLALNGAVSDAAIAAWGVKAHYDYVRPISMIRFMAGLGQSSDPDLPSYHPQGLPLETGLSELITSESAAPGQRHAHLADHVGEIALFTWMGEPDDPENEVGGVGWVPALQWSTYQLSTFVTPPFAGYVSGHSTFSRAAAEVLTGITGTPFFPGGLGSYTFEGEEWLDFENGPTETMQLQWATYYDAADQAGLSRLYGGIHVRADDFQGRIMGSQIGISAWEKAKDFYSGTAEAAEGVLRYADWASVRLLGQDTAPDAVVAADGIDNFTLFAFGLGLDAADRSGLPRWRVFPGETDRFELLYQRPVSVAGVDYRIEFSDDLVDWKPVPDAAVQEIVSPAGVGKVRCSVSVDSGGATPIFYRLRVAAK